VKDIWCIIKLVKIKTPIFLIILKQSSNSKNYSAMMKLQKLFFKLHVPMIAKLSDDLWKISTLKYGRKIEHVLFPLDSIPKYISIVLFHQEKCHFSFSVHSRRKNETGDFKISRSFISWSSWSGPYLGCWIP
jgi:hypothetical protein